METGFTVCTLPGTAELAYKIANKQYTDLMSPASTQMSEFGQYGLTPTRSNSETSPSMANKNRLWRACIWNTIGWSSHYRVIEARGFLALAMQAGASERTAKNILREWVDEGLLAVAQKGVYINCVCRPSVSLAEVATRLVRGSMVSLESALLGEEMCTLGCPAPRDAGAGAVGVFVGEPKRGNRTGGEPKNGDARRSDTSGSVPPNSTAGARLCAPTALVHLCAPRLDGDSTSRHAPEGLSVTLHLLTPEMLHPDLPDDYIFAPSIYPCASAEKAVADWIYLRAYRPAGFKGPPCECQPPGALRFGVLEQISEAMGIVNEMDMWLQARDEWEESIHRSRREARSAGGWLHAGRRMPQRLAGNAGTIPI